jgi:hypothetical protein
VLARGAKGEQIDLLHDVDGYFKPGTDGGFSSAMISM